MLVVAMSIRTMINGDDDHDKSDHEMFTSCGPCRYGWLAGTAGYELG